MSLVLSPLEVAQKDASMILTNFITAIETILIESSQQLIESPIKLEFFKDNTTPPKIYRNWKRIEYNRLNDFTFNGYYIIEKFDKQIEKKLKQQFPTLVYKSEKQIWWTITLEEFIDPKPILKIAGMEEK